MPNLNRKLKVQNSKDEFFRDESSDSPCSLSLIIGQKCLFFIKLQQNAVINMGVNKENKREQQQIGAST